ncbi:ParA family protein [Sorangium sp. So ce185]|uniref:ParA family protein n=1 Tax=Sorangium sp. So ce185 TaxID=3133287 RepID=UPI003F6463D6
MGLAGSYSIWNNKGGVGKSTITFHLASRYAEVHPKRNVLVIDLCPQSNSSMMLLGGGALGEDKALSFCQETPVPRTVVGYLSTVFSRGPAAPRPKWNEFLVKPSDFNKALMDNIYLLCGDGNLEPMAPLISEQARQAALTPSANPWKWVHLAIRTFINDVVHENGKDWLVLIDTNPSFSIYTEIAISSADKLIVPVNADDASRVAANAMFTLIYGTDPPHPIYGQYTYAKRAEAEGIRKPIIHLIIGNRLTQYDGPATAFAAMSDATANSLFEAYRSNPERFSPTQRKIVSMEGFRNAFSVPLRDFNTAGVVAAHVGKPLSVLRANTYNVHGVPVDLKADRLQECREAIDTVIRRI